MPLHCGGELVRDWVQEGVGGGIYRVVAGVEVGAFALAAGTGGDVVAVSV